MISCLGAWVGFNRNVLQCFSSDFYLKSLHHGGRASGEGPFFGPAVVLLWLQLLYPSKRAHCWEQGYLISCLLRLIPVSISLDGALLLAFLDNAEVNSLICNQRVLCWLTGSSETHRKPETMEFTISEPTFPVPSLAVILISPEEMHYYVNSGGNALSLCSVETWLQCPGRVWRLTGQK